MTHHISHANMALELRQKQKKYLLKFLVFSIYTFFVLWIYKSRFAKLLTFTSISLLLHNILDILYQL